MTDVREDMTKAARDQMAQIAHLRGCSFTDAAVAVESSYKDNLRDSLGTSMESYWRDMTEVASGIVRRELGQPW